MNAVTDELLLSVFSWLVSTLQARDVACRSDTECRTGARLRSSWRWRCGPVFDDVVDQSSEMFVPRRVALSLLRSRRHVNVVGVAFRRGIYCECCIHQCNYNELMEYCRSTDSPLIQWQRTAWNMQTVQNWINVEFIAQNARRDVILSANYRHWLNALTEYFLFFFSSSKNFRIQKSRSVVHFKFFCNSSSQVHHSYIILYRKNCIQCI